MSVFVKRIDKSNLCCCFSPWKQIQPLLSVRFSLWDANLDSYDCHKSKKNSKNPLLKLQLFMLIQAALWCVYEGLVLHRLIEFIWQSLTNLQKSVKSTVFLDTAITAYFHSIFYSFKKQFLEFLIKTQTWYQDRHQALAITDKIIKF